MPAPLRRTIERRFPRAAVQRAVMLGAGRRWLARHEERQVIEAIEDLQCAAEPTPPPRPADETYLETYELDPLSGPTASLLEDLAAPDAIDDELDGLAAVEVIRPAPVADYSRFVAAMKAKRRPADPAPAGELPPALSPEECRRCGIPGFKGCEHQTPYVRPAPPPMKAVGHNGGRPPKARSASWPWKGEGN